MDRKVVYLDEDDIPYPYREQEKARAVETDTAELNLISG